jgi:hypothetical protein
MVELDIKAVEEWLTIGMTLNRKTFKKGMKYKLPETLKYNGAVGKPSVDRVIKAYEDCIIKECEGKKNILLQLSGGKDSRLIAALLKKNDIDFSAVVYGDGNCLEVYVAKAVAKVLKIPIKTFTDIKGIYDMEAVVATIISNHGLRLYHGLLNQYHFRDYLRQFDLVLDGYQANYLFDSHCCLDYPRYPWLYLLEEQYAYIPCSVNSTRVFFDFAKEYYTTTLEETWLKEINNARALDFTTVQKWGINDVPVVNQEVVDAVYALPYHARSGIILTQKMIGKINRALWLLPYSSYGGFPLGVPYKKHLWLYNTLQNKLPKWRFADPSESEKYTSECFSDYIKTLPSFVEKLSMVDVDKCLSLLKTSIMFRDRVMNFKIWCENEIY